MTLPPSHSSIKVEPSIANHYYYMYTRTLGLVVILALSSFTHASDGPPDSLLTHLRPLVTPTPPSTRPPSPSPPQSPPQQDMVVQFTKKIYKDLGNNWNNASRVADKYRDEFDQLDQNTGGRLGETLNSLIEIRMLDLQASIRHAKRMHRLIDDFTGKLIFPSSI